MKSRTDCLRGGRLLVSGSRRAATETSSILNAFGMVRARFGAARGRGDHPSQANARFQSSVLDESSFRLVDPVDQSARSSSSWAWFCRSWSCVGGGRGRWLVIRLLCALTMLPPIWAASARIYGPAGFLLALGLATRLVPVLERHATGFRRLVRVSFPIVACLVPIPGGVVFGASTGSRCGARRRGRSRRRAPQTSS